MKIVMDLNPEYLRYLPFEILCTLDLSGWRYNLFLFLGNENITRIENTHDCCMDPDHWRWKDWRGSSAIGPYQDWLWNCRKYCNWWGCGQVHQRSIMIWSWWISLLPGKWNGITATKEIRKFSRIPVIYPTVFLAGFLFEVDGSLKRTLVRITCPL